MGYTETPHNYRVYFPNNIMIVVRWDIKFDEGKAMRLSLERELDLHAEEELLVPKVELIQIYAGMQQKTHITINTKMQQK